MIILVLVSGIVDQKWPISASTLQDASAFAALQRTLSPFDESALECALKLRDSQPSTSIHALVVSPSQSLLKAVSAFRLQSVRGLSVTPHALWDPRLLASTLAAEITGSIERPDAVFIGREFGDCDDGTLPPCLAEALQWHFVGLAQQACWEGIAGLTLLRERSELEERIHCKPPVLASVTNDKRNRLRYPLMKNIAAAKKERFNVSPAGEGATHARICLNSVADATMDKPTSVCRMISGDIEAQVAELARLLRSSA